MEKTKNNKSLVFLIVTSLIFVITAVLALVVAVPAFLDPAHLIKYSRKLYVIFSIFGTIAWGIIVRKIYSTISAGIDKKVLIGFSKLINCFAIFAVLSLFVMSAFTFYESIDTIKISNYDELKYVQNCPGANFDITKDIDCGGELWTPVGKFTGEIDGRKHKISNIKLGSGGFIKKNEGVVKYLNFKKVNCDDAPNSIEFGVVACKNYGTVKHCKLLDYKKAKKGKTVKAKNRLIGLNMGKTEKNKGYVKKGCPNGHNWGKKKYNKADKERILFKRYTHKCKTCTTESKGVEFSDLGNLVLVLVGGFFFVLIFRVFFDWLTGNNNTPHDPNNDYIDMGGSYMDASGDLSFDVTDM